MSPPVIGHPGRRLLVLQRHAKSDWPPGVDDADRPLAARGRRDAPVAARVARDLAGVPDRVLVSPARRTQETFEEMARVWRNETGQVIAPQLDDRIYEATAADLLGIVNGLSDTDRVVMLIGHSPGLEELALTWPSTADPDALHRLTAKFPTAAIAVISIEGSWLNGEPRLEAMAVPRAELSDQTGGRRTDNP